MASRARRVALAGGFSLLELMMVLVIASILYFVALPGYEQAVIGGTRAAARGVLYDVLSRQEQYFMNFKRYASALEQLGLPSPYYIDGQAQIAAPGQAAYRVELALDTDADAFLGVQALPMNRQARDSACKAFTLKRSGSRAVSGTLAANPSACW
jgi:type IV pilus assembly protein PilE